MMQSTRSYLEALVRVNAATNDSMHKQVISMFCKLEERVNKLEQYAEPEHVLAYDVLIDENKRLVEENKRLYERINKLEYTLHRERNKPTFNMSYR